MNLFLVCVCLSVCPSQHQYLPPAMPQQWHYSVYTGHHRWAAAYFFKGLSTLFPIENAALKAAGDRFTKNNPGDPLNISTNSNFSSSARGFSKNCFTKDPIRTYGGKLALTLGDFLCIFILCELNQYAEQYNFFEPDVCFSSVTDELLTTVISWSS